MGSREVPSQADWACLVNRMDCRLPCLEIRGHRSFILNFHDKPGGGAGPYWHCTEASRTHEWAHWNEDWVADAVNSSKGGNWPAVNAKIERLWVSKVLGRFTKEAGRKALEPLVNKQIDELDDEVTDRWNEFDPTDKPGAGGRGYAPPGLRFSSP